MNKQELIKKYEDLFKTLHVFPVVAINRVLEDLRQLDEPQKVQVPQFVADWYEENKDDFETKLSNEIDLMFRELEDDNLSEFEEWILHKHTAPFQTLVNMHQFGYEIEKEKRYRVKMKGVTDQTRTLKRNIDIETWYFGNPTNYEDINAHHTRKELENAGFGWVFDCEGIEIKEVEK